MVRTDARIGLNTGRRPHAVRHQVRRSASAPRRAAMRVRVDARADGCARLPRAPLARDSESRPGGPLRSPGFDTGKRQTPRDDAQRARGRRTPSVLASLQGLRPRSGASWCVITTRPVEVTLVRADANAELRPRLTTKRL